MTLTPFFGSSSRGTGFRWGPVNNIFGSTPGGNTDSPFLVTPATSRAAAEAQQENYFIANPLILAEYDAPGAESLGVALYFIENGTVTTIPQTRVSGNWVDNGGIFGFPGIPGSGADLTQVTDGHIPVAMTEGGVKVYRDSGLALDMPLRRFVTPLSMQVNEGSLYLGDAHSIGAGLHAAVLTDADSEKAYFAQQFFNGDGINPIRQLETANVGTFNLTTVSNTTLPSPVNFLFQPLTTNAYTWMYSITPTGIPLEGATIQVEAWLGVDDTGARAVNEVYQLTQANNGVATPLLIPNPPQGRLGDQLFTRFTGVSLLGGVQSGSLDPAYDGQILPALSARVVSFNLSNVLSETDVSNTPSGLVKYTADTDGVDGNPVLPAVDGRNIVGLNTIANFTDHFEISEVSNFSFNWTPMGLLSVDAAENSIEFIKSTYDQNVSVSTTVQARVVDKTEGGSNLGTVYFSATRTSNSRGMKYLTYTVVNPLPSTGDVTLEVQLRKTTAGAITTHDSTFGKRVRKP